jgi:hypothetical protein
MPINLGASTESLQGVKRRRSRIEALIIERVNALDPSGDNGKRYKEFFSTLSDTKFAEYMELLRKGDIQVNIVMPNMTKPMKISNIIKAAEDAGVKISHRLWLYDKISGRKYLTNEKYLVLTLPVRRAQQEWDKKLSVPERDRTIDSMTGQVMRGDDACALSAPEIQSLGVRGLSATLTELIKVRGGDVTAYGDFKRQMQENGEARLSTLDPRTRVRSADIAKVWLRCMMLDSNI